MTRVAKTGLAGQGWADHEGLARRFLAMKGGPRGLAWSWCPEPGQLGDLVDSHRGVLLAELAPACAEPVDQLLAGCGHRDRQRVGADTAPAQQERVHRRPRSDPGAHTPQGADPPAPHTQVRALRAAHHGGCPPSRQARPARDTRTRPARVGRPHGQETAQDPRGLPTLPRGHPRNPSHASGVIAGEPSALKGARWVRREAARKRPDFTTGEPDLAAQPTLSTRASSPPRSTSTPTSRSSSERSIAPHPSGPPPVDTGRPTPCSPSSTACDYAEERGLSDPLTSTNDRLPSVNSA